MTQIVFGLQSPWVERLRTTWSHVPRWETRVLRDLRALTSPKRNFGHMRRVMDVMIAEEGLEEIVNSAGPPDIFSANASSAATSSARGCVPFCGLFLMDLMENDILPTVIHGDGVHDPQTLEQAGFKALPLSLQDRPMVNVLKFRVLAMIIKTVIAFQERARSYNISASSALYLRCLRLRCLPAPVLT